MARPDVNIVTQIGVESTPGTGVTAAKKLSSTGIQFSPELMARFYRAAGNKYPTTGVRHRQWAVGSFDGVLSYNEIVYVLAGLFGHGTVTTPEGSAKSWPIAPNTAGADARKHFTIQRGDSTAAQEVNYGSFTSLTINFAEDSIDISGDVLARAIDNAATLDAVSATIAESPVSVADLNWYIDSTYAGIGTTQWTDVTSATLTIPGVVTPKFVQNTTYTSFSELVEIPIEDITLTITAEFNAQTRAIYDALNTDSLPARFIQCKAIGEIISGATPQTFKGNFAAKLAGCRPANPQSLYGYEFDFRLFHESTMGRALEFTVINTTAAL